MTDVQLAGIGLCSIPDEFGGLIGEPAAFHVCEATEPPDSILKKLAGGAAVVLTGPYAYADAVMRYCNRYEKRLVRYEECSAIPDQSARVAAFAEIRRKRLFLLLAAARGESLLGITDPPETPGLQDWLVEKQGEDAFLIPLRKFQRIVTDMRRARDGIPAKIIAGTITILPHVYVPTDMSIPAMFSHFSHAICNKRVLDMGTGTGILALLAAKMGAGSVVAADMNPNAVLNARMNVERFGMGEVIEVRDAADLFDSVKGETFDAIMFNTPWLIGRPNTVSDAAIRDPENQVLARFITEAPRHLAPGGAVLLQWSDCSVRAMTATGIEGLIETSGLKIAASRRRNRLSRALGIRENVYVFEIRRA